MANKLAPEKRAQILALLTEGNSLRGTSRIADVSINTVTKLLVDAGLACSEYQDRALRNLPCKRVQVDEIWSFCYAKQKNVPEEMKGQLGVGDIWTWVAIDADTKLVPSWFVGSRDNEHARAFMDDLASRMAGRIQLTSDGHRAYKDAVADTFQSDVDFAQLVKIYGESAEAKQEKRYSPAECIGCEQHVVTGKPDHKHISTSFVERQNLTMRMCIKRFARLTNAFSKKAQNHCHAVALHFMYYNFCRIHKTLRVTPAMAAEVTSRVWDVADIVKLVEGYESNKPVAVETSQNKELEQLAGEGYVPSPLRPLRSSLRVKD